MSCLVKAAILRGGTARAARGGKRTEESERRRRTVVVWMLTLLSVVEGAFGSGRWRDLEESSMSGLRDKAWRVR